MILSTGLKFDRSDSVRYILKQFTCKQNNFPLKYLLMFFTQSNLFQTQPHIRDLGLVQSVWLLMYRC
jgi:predicted patatin/cPLA2 family phospholipase